MYIYCSQLVLYLYLEKVSSFLNFEIILLNSTILSICFLKNRCYKINLNDYH